MMIDIKQLHKAFDFDGDKMMQRTFYIFYLLIFSILSGLNQQATAGFYFEKPKIEDQKEIDELIKEANDKYTAEKYTEAFNLYTTIKEKSQKAEYSKGLVSAYLGYSGVYFLQSKLDVSTAYLVKAKEEPYAENNPKVLYTIYFREGLNLHAIGLYEDAVKRYNKALQLIPQIEDEEDKINKTFSVHNNIGDMYQQQNQIDSALYYYKSAYNSPTTNLDNKFTSSVSISELHIEKKELDSAKIYLNFAEYYSQKINANYANSILNKIKGKYMLAIGEVDDAIELYKNSIDLNQQLNRPKPELFKLLSEAYTLDGNDETSNFYLKKYVEVKDSLSAATLQNIKVPIILAQTANEGRLEEAESSIKMIFLLTTALIVLFSLSAYYYIHKQRKKRLERKEENIQLKKKLNHAFDEVVDLAENNSPNFISRFIEVYPEFYNQLITDYPDLTAADIKLCALLKLDYSTKEIAEITFSSLRTVQNRMYRLRKKFNLSSHEKLDRWIQTFHLESNNTSISI